MFHLNPWGSGDAHHLPWPVLWLVAGTGDARRVFPSTYSPEQAITEETLQVLPGITWVCLVAASSASRTLS